MAHDERRRLLADVADDGGACGRIRMLVPAAPAWLRHGGRGRARPPGCAQPGRSRAVAAVRARHGPGAGEPVPAVPVFPVLMRPTPRNWALGVGIAVWAACSMLTIVAEAMRAGHLPPMRLVPGLAGVTVPEQVDWSWRNLLRGRVQAVIARQVGLDFP